VQRLKERVDPRRVARRKREPHRGEEAFAQRMIVFAVMMVQRFVICHAHLRTSASDHRRAARENNHAGAIYPARRRP
jgi:hypothetical protein